jgi:AI-2 transport protein TqsA
MNDVEKSSAARTLVVAASLVILIAGMKAAASILVPFLLALFIAIIATPLFLGLQQRGVNSAVALLIMSLLVVIVGLLVVAAVRGSLDGFSDNLSNYEYQLQTRITHVGSWLEAKGIESPDDIISETFNPNAAMGYLGTVTSTLSSMLANAFLILLVAVFILLEAAIMPAKVRALPGISDEMWTSLQGMVEDVRRYMSLKTLTSFLTGILVGIATAVIGVDYPVLLGLLAFLLNYVPNVGSFIAAVPGVMLAFIQFGFGGAAGTALAYTLINVGVGNVIEPRLMGRGLGLSPLVILLSMIFWGWVLGPVGMLLSVPLTMAVKIAFESGKETQWIALLMGSRVPDEKVG